jgi:hypothetical protein
MAKNGMYGRLSEAERIERTHVQPKKEEESQ